MGVFAGFFIVFSDYSSRAEEEREKEAGRMQEAADPRHGCQDGKKKSD